MSNQLDQFDWRPVICHDGPGEIGPVRPTFSTAAATSLVSTRQTRKFMNCFLHHRGRTGKGNHEMND